MSVPEGERSHGSTLEVLVKARELASYTLHICTNENTFPPQFQAAITGKIEETAINIFVDCWTANNILIGKDPERWQYRKRLQERAANNCNNLLAIIQIAQAVFHLKLKRVKYWGSMIIDTRNLIRGWRESDCKRYDKLLK
jgi:hypothetical protein